MNKKLNAINAELAPHRIDIRPYRSQKWFADARFLARRRAWGGGYEVIGYFETLDKAASAARETALG